MSEVVTTTFPPDPDHELVDHLLTYRQPTSDDVVRRMEHLRGLFIELGHEIVDQVDRSPDRTVALRELHRACMATIAALALNQPEG